MSLKRKSYTKCPICGSYCTEETDYMEHILCEEYTKCIHGHYGIDYAYGNSRVWFRLPNGIYSECAWTYTEHPNFKAWDKSIKKLYDEFRRKTNSKTFTRKSKVKNGEYLFELKEWF